MTPLIPLVGQRFGRLVVVERAPNGLQPSQWRCLCDCGAESVVRGADLRSGRTRSCGCFRREVQGKGNRTHGASNCGGVRRPSREYRIWSNAKTRCYNPKNEKYHRYGGRGIRMCEAWRNDFAQFLRDVGPCPPGLSLDRYPNNDGNYEPGNVRWATASEQRRNQSSFDHSLVAETEAANAG